MEFHSYFSNHHAQSSHHPFIPELRQTTSVPQLHDGLAILKKIEDQRPWHRLFNEIQTVSPAFRIGFQQLTQWWIRCIRVRVISILQQHIEYISIEGFLNGPNLSRTKLTSPKLQIILVEKSNILLFEPNVYHLKSKSNVICTWP